MTGTSHASEPWLAAIEASSARVGELVAGLDVDGLGRPSFAADWSVAQVLSHLGSAAEISTVLLERGVAGSEEGPRPELVRPVWDRWDALAPADQRFAWVDADRRHRELLTGLDATQLDTVRVPYFSGLLDVTTYTGYRLSEQSVHAWDVEVSLDAAATIPEAETDLLIERIDLVATRFRDGEVLAAVGPCQVVVELTDRPSTMTLDLGTELHLYPCATTGATGTLTGTAEEVLRLVYGRHRSTDSTAAEGAMTLEQLRGLFPGY